MTEHVFNFNELGLSPEVILHEIGYKKVIPPKEVSDTLNTILTKVSALVQPACVFQLLNGGIKTSAVVLENKITLQVGPVIAPLLKGSERFAVFAATAGLPFQKYQEFINLSGNILDIYILDTIGSCLVEKAGDLMEALLENEIKEYKHTSRFSPGYCGWSLMEQKVIFSTLKGSPCGISLSDVCLMSPIKSISGIIGIGMNVGEKKYGCDICQLETCYKRKNKKKSI